MQLKSEFLKIYSCPPVEIMIYLYVLLDENVFAGEKNYLEKNVLLTEEISENYTKKCSEKEFLFILPDFKRRSFKDRRSLKRNRDNVVISTEVCTADSEITINAKKTFVPLFTPSIIQQSLPADNIVTEFPE